MFSEQKISKKYHVFDFMEQRPKGEGVSLYAELMLYISLYIFFICAIHVIMRSNAGFCIKYHVKLSYTHHKNDSEIF